MTDIDEICDRVVDAIARERAELRDRLSRETVTALADKMQERLGVLDRLAEKIEKANPGIFGGALSAKSAAPRTRH
jgi:hypothetical protein